MWPKAYRDYPVDSALKKEKIFPSHGTIGCEMHELNGWGNSYQFPVKKRKGMLGKILEPFNRDVKRPESE